MSHSIFNRRWAAVILHALTRHGINHVCIAPGSRSAPLTLEAANRMICHTHFDERGLGHLALGLAKATRQPIAIIVTSGTAVANLYPAVIEASLTGERLIVISADRPPELIDCGANQAINQSGIFASHISAFLNLPRPTPDIPARWLASAVDALLQQDPSGAVHLNCPFADPLYGDDDTQAFQCWHDTLGNWWQDDARWLTLTVSQHTPVASDWESWRQKRGVIIAGKMHAEEGVQLAAWAAELGWPLLSDVQSQTGMPLPCAEVWLCEPHAQETLSQAQIILQFGGHLTGKRLTSWLAAADPEAWWLVDPQPGRLDPAHHRGWRIRAEVADWLAVHPAVKQPCWCPSLVTLAKETHTRLASKLAHFGEAELAMLLPALLPPQGSVFLGNSLTIRLADAFTRLPAGYPVFANRGASGIDGLISTAAGIQRGSQKPLLAIIGDLSALYDLNSLALLTQLTVPLVLIVVNNNGGQIFSLLPTPADRRERFFSMPQQVDFAAAAAMFALQYYQPDSGQSLRSAVEQAWLSTKATIIELRVEDSQGAALLAAAVKGAL